MEEEQDYVGISEASRLLGISREAVRQRLQAAKVFGHKVIGGRHHFAKNMLTREIWGIKRNGK